jgi:hypothetical protein
VKVLTVLCALVAILYSLLLATAAGFSFLVDVSVFLLVTFAVLFDRFDVDECGFPLVIPSDSFCPLSFRAILC